MEVNTLVRHNKLKSLGIGCISKVMSKSVKVNFGTEDVMTCSLKALSVVDTSKCKTLSFRDWQRMSMVNSKDLPKNVIIGNELKHYVGIGWTSQRVVTEGDLTKYPRVI